MKLGWLANPGNQIPIAVLLAVIIGIIINMTFPEVPDDVVTLLKLPGDLWLRCLQCIVTPLILISMITSMQMLKKVPGGAGKKLAQYALFYYFVTTMIALIISVLLSILILKGTIKPRTPQEIAALSVNFVKKEREIQSILQRVIGIILGVIPDNIVKVMADNQLVAIIVMGVVIGILINDTPSKPSALISFCKEVEKIISSIVGFLIKLCPIGVFFLILPTLIKMNIAILGGLVGWYIFAIILACFIQLLVVYPAIYFVFMRKNPFTYLWGFAPAMITSFGTASSAATIPVTMECAHKLGIKPAIYKLLTPLGVSLNMDGSGINLPMAVIFLAYASGHPLGIADYMLLIFTGFLATIGAAPVPAATIFFYEMLMASINLEQNGLFVLLIGTDWLTERPATVLNVIGDTIIMPIVQKYVLRMEIDPSTNEEFGKDEEKLDKKKMDKRDSIASTIEMKHPEKTL